MFDNEVKRVPNSASDLGFPFSKVDFGEDVFLPDLQVLFVILIVENAVSVSI